MPPEPYSPVNAKHGRGHDIKSGSGAKATIQRPLPQTIEFAAISIGISCRISIITVKFSNQLRWGFQVF